MPATPQSTRSSDLSRVSERQVAEGGQRDGAGYAAQLPMNEPEFFFGSGAPGDVAHLVDVRQIGPHSDREISGVCSFCGDTLLACLHDLSVASTLARLQAELETVFQRHAAQH